MPRLIDANKLRKDILDLPNCYNGFSDTYDKAMIIDLIDEQPTVDAVPVAELPYTVWLTHDVVQVVRCKDCKFWHTEGQYCDRFGVMWEEFYTSPNDYCSRGERREDADN